MPEWFAVDHLDLDRLLAEWRWLCPNPMSLVARNAFGDLFLRDQAGQIHRLDVAIGTLLKVADSEAQFKELATSKREEWFAESDEVSAAAKGLKPNLTQCIGFSVPLVFRGSPIGPNKPYVADLYEHIAFLGDINQQIAKLPIAARGAWRSSAGISLTHQIQVFRSEVKTGVYKVEPAITLKQGEYALFLARGQGMAPYVYDFSVQENLSSTATSEPAEPKTILTTPIRDVAESSQHNGEGWIGLATELKRTIRHDGVPLSGVCEGGPADQAGIQTGDTILSIASQYLYTVDKLSAAIRQLEPGSKVPVRYQRRAMIVDTYVIVGRQSSAPLSQYPM